MTVNKATTLDFTTQVLGAKTPVLVDFYAEWCGPCKMMEPVLEELEKEYQGKISFFRVNVDEEQSLAGEYKVMSIPTVVLFSGGKIISQQTGFSGKESLVNLLKKGGDVNG